MYFKLKSVSIASFINNDSDYAALIEANTELQSGLTATRNQGTRHLVLETVRINLTFEIMNVSKLYPLELYCISLSLKLGSRGSWTLSVKI